MLHPGEILSRLIELASHVISIFLHQEIIPSLLGFLRAVQRHLDSLKPGTHPQAADPYEGPLSVQAD
jgi:hypothetical protein